jgi:ribulose-phosphate 3-epimerase
MSKRTEIIPAILPKDFVELEDRVSEVKGFTKTVQIDVCDGQFTPQASWPYRKRDDTFEKIAHEAEGLPGWKDLDYEIDLMVNKPEEVVEQWVTAGATRIIIHIESKGDVGKALEILKGRVEVGLALNIDTPIERIAQFNNETIQQPVGIQFIQLMGIDHIGFQGQEFDSKVIEKIKEVKKMFPDYPISIDGGVSLDNALRLIESGANRLVVGSAIFESENPLEALQTFKRL